MKLLKLAFFFLAVIATNNLQAQVIGKIFDKDYADQEFGQVVNFLEINIVDLNKLLDSTDEYIMFNIDNGTIRALNEERKGVQGAAISNEEVFYKMSTSQVKLLMKNGEKSYTKIEMRPKTLTLTNGDFTLELVDPCPPWCI